MLCKAQSHLYWVGGGTTPAGWKMALLRGVNENVLCGTRPESDVEVGIFIRADG